MTVSSPTVGAVTGRVDLPPFETVVDAVLDVAARTPERVAVRDRNTTLTYAGLVAEVQRCRQVLQAHGVGHGDRVVTVLSRSVLWPAAVLATWSLGAVYVPVHDPSDDRARELLLGSDGRVVLVDGPVTAAPGMPPVLRIDRLLPGPDDAAGLGTRTGVAPGTTCRADDPAYVLFTSGSTGRPKGVQVGHRALAAFCWAFGRVTGVSPDTVALGYSAATFDVSMLDLFVPLTHGAQVAIIGDDERLDPALVQRWCRSQGVTWGFLPIALLGMVDPDALPRWHTVIAGAESPSPGLVRRWTARQDRTFFNCYGPTEATVTCCAYRVPAGTDGADADGVVPFGRPLPNHTALVLGPNGPVAAGEVGELCVAGVGLADGYLAVAPDDGHDGVHDGDGAFCLIEGERYYRTGDQVRVGRDGDLRFVGRLDRQVKIRGQRVELAEVEARIETHPLVAHAVTRVMPDAAGPSLVTYYRGTATPDQLGAWAAEHLPAPQRPRRWHPVASFPLTSSGKIDESALTASPPAGPIRRDDPDEFGPVGQVWDEILGAGPPDGAFYARGGDSVLAMQVSANLWERHRIRVPVAAVLRAQSVGDLVRSIADGETTTPGRGVPEGTDQDEGVPLTPAGERLWLGWHLAPASTANTIQVVRRIQGRVDGECLRRALTDLPRRHPVLASRVDPETTRLVPGETDPMIRVPDRELAEDALDRALAADLAEPFDLEHGPLWRARALPVGLDQVLVLTFHHLVFDGWSLAPVLNSVAAGYAGLPTDVDEGYRQHGWARAARHETDGGRDLDWWREHLSGATTMLPLPGWLATGRTGSGRRVRHSVPQPLLEASRDLARATGCSPAAVHLAALADALGRITAVDDLVVGVPVAEREHPHLGRAVGMFTEVLPTRHRPHPTSTFRQLCAESQQELTGGAAHGTPGLQEIARAVDAERHPARAALVQVLFNSYTFDGEARLGLPGTTDRPVDAAVPATDFDLTVYHLTVEGAPVLETLTDAAVDPERVLALLTGLVERWAALVAAPDAELGSIPVPAPLRAVAAPPGGPHPAAAPTTGLGARAVGRPGPRVSPRPGVEEYIARVWAEVLDIPFPGATDNFFDVGGHSMAIAQVHERLARHGLPVSLIDLFAHPTVRALADFCQQESGEVATRPTAARVAATRGQARRAAAARRRRPGTGSSRRDTT